LKKEDFELFINGKKHPVSGFYTLQKKLEFNAAQPAGQSPAVPELAPQPRLFVLIFNITDLHMNINSLLDSLFSRVIQANDRIIVITNRFFFPEWSVISPEQTKTKVQEILQKEIDNTKFEVVRYENEIKAQGVELLSKLADDFFMNNPSPVLEDFFLNYKFVLEDIKEDYLTLPVEKYIKIAEYLKGQDIDKWVLNFYEIGRLPLLDSMGEISKKVDYFYNIQTGGDNAPSGGLSASAAKEDNKSVKQTIQKLYLDYLLETQKMDDILLRDINKSFLNSGATFHTLLLNPASRYLSENFKYQNITTQGETILKDMARLTGGAVVNSNRIDTFLDAVSVKPDILYVLTYVPDNKAKNSELDIRVKDNKNYRLVFDNQRRHKAFSHIVKSMRQNKKQLEITALEHHGNTVAVKLKNIELVDYEGESYGAVRARIKIIGQNKKVIARFEKTYKGIDENGVFQVQLPKLTAGPCKIVVEVKDLFSLNSVYSGDAITVK